MSAPPKQASFPTTRWSIIQTIQDPEGAGEKRAHDALSELCSSYWYPIYARARKGGATPQDAEDLTQAFFAKLIERDSLLVADQDKGKLRTFLLTVFDRFVNDNYKRANALKRGGGKTVFSIDQAAAEERLSLEPVDHLSADKLFERSWASVLLTHVMEKLASEFRSRGQADFFATMLPYLPKGSVGDSLVSLAPKLEMSESALRVALHRMRKRYRKLLELEIAETVATQSEIASEIDHLLGVFAD